MLFGSLQRRRRIVQAFLRASDPNSMESKVSQCYMQSYCNDDICDELEISLRKLYKIKNNIKIQITIIGQQDEEA